MLKNFKYILSIFLLFAIPPIGVLLFLQNVNMTLYLEFPPLTKYVQHANFSFNVLLFYLIIEVFLYASIFYFFFCGFRKEKQARLDQNNKCFPWWGYLAATLLFLFWVLAWNRFDFYKSLQRHTFTPLWLCYIVILNALTYKRSSKCLMLNQRVNFLLLFPVSGIFWWYFEWANRFVQNWYYVGVEIYTPSEYFILATLPFATVLPAVISTYSFLRTFKNQSFMCKLKVIKFKNIKLICVITVIISVITLSLTGCYPNILFPFIWISPLFILIPIQVLSGEKTILSPIRDGDWSSILTSCIAALICGFFWEMWNSNSLAKWIYSIPYLDNYHLFEMPLIGYAGYLPFGLECLAIASIIISLDNVNKELIN